MGGAATMEPLDTVTGRMGVLVCISDPLMHSCYR